MTNIKVVLPKKNHTEDNTCGSVRFKITLIVASSTCCVCDTLSVTVAATVFYSARIVTHYVIQKLERNPCEFHRP
jgi:hypothetical protein